MNRATKSGPAGVRSPHLESPNRRLIRPPLAQAVKESGGSRNPRTAAPPAKLVKPKQTPPDTTNAENFYYIKQMQSKTPMVIVLLDGEELHGVIEWYDKLCLKITREEGPNLLVYKSYIKYLYKA